MKNQVVLRPITHVDPHTLNSLWNQKSNCWIKNFYI